MLANDSLAAFWMPFTANRAFKAHPRLLVSAKDMHYRIARRARGARRHRRPVVRQRRPLPRADRRGDPRTAGELDYAPTFQLGHPLAFELSTRLAALMPAGLDRIFLANSGSEAVDSALKIALAYHRARGDGGRTRLIGRERGYHGTGFGGISVGGLVNNRRAFGTLLTGVDHLPHTHSLADMAFSRGQPAMGRAPRRRARAAGRAAWRGDHRRGDRRAGRRIDRRAGAARRAISSGCAKSCTRHGILLIFDEVITAFGRLGTATAAERFGVTPDLITMAKGLTNGAVPMGAVAASRTRPRHHRRRRRRRHRAVPRLYLFGPSAGRGGGASPRSTSIATSDCSTAPAASRRSGKTRCTRLRGAPNVIDLRNLGLVAGIELAPRGGAPGERGMELFHACFDAGLLVRATGDTIALSPPLIVDEAQIDSMFGTIAEQIARID